METVSTYGIVYGYGLLSDLGESRTSLQSLVSFLLQQMSCLIVIIGRILFEMLNNYGSNVSHSLGCLGNMFHPNQLMGDYKKKKITVMHHIIMIYARLDFAKSALMILITIGFNLLTCNLSIAFGINR